MRLENSLTLTNSLLLTKHFNIFVVVVVLNWADFIFFFFLSHNFLIYISYLYKTIPNRLFCKEMLIFIFVLFFASISCVCIVQTKLECETKMENRLLYAKNWFHFFIFYFFFLSAVHTLGLQFKHRALVRVFFPFIQGSKHSQNIYSCPPWPCIIKMADEKKKTKTVWKNKNYGLKREHENQGNVVYTKQHTYTHSIVTIQRNKNCYISNAQKVSRHWKFVVFFLSRLFETKILSNNTVHCTLYNILLVI